MTGALSVICQGENDLDATHAGRTERIASYIRNSKDPSKVDLWVTMPVSETHKYAPTAERQEHLPVTRDRLRCPLCRFTLVKKEDAQFHRVMTTLINHGVPDVTLRRLAAILK